MAIDTGALYYLVDPFVQWENVNGKPIVGGHVEVFEAGTDNKIITYADWDGTRHPFKIPLGSDGRAVILVDPGYRYDAYVYDSFNNLVCSRLNIIPLSDGDITIDGMGQVYHDETLSGKGTPNSPLTVISGGKVYGGIYPIDVNNELDMISADNVPLGVQSPLYFAQDDDEGLVIALSSVPVPEGTMNESAFGYENNKITGYNGTAFAGQGGGVTGDFTLVEGNGIQLTDDPIAQTTTISVSGDYATLEDVESATSALFPNSAVTPLVKSIYTGIFANTVNYKSKPSADEIYADANTLVNVGQIVGLNHSNFYIVPSSILQVPKIITAYNNGLTAGVLTADSSNGLIFSNHQSVNFSSNYNGLIHSAKGSYFSAGYNGLYNSATGSYFSAGYSGLYNSGKYTTFSAGVYGIYNLVEYFPSLFISGRYGKIDINLTGGSAVDSYGNKKWQIGEADHVWSFADGNPTYTGRPIVLCYYPQTASASAPYFIAGPGGFTSEYIQNNNVLGLYGDFGQGIRYTNAQYKVTATLNVNDIQYNRYNTATSATDAWSLIGSVQKREIECDTATSAITAIAGSAIGGGGGGVPQSAFDELKQSYDALSALFAQYSGQWLLPNEGEE